LSDGGMLDVAKKENSKMPAVVIADPAAIAVVR
jgi:hypothetical protein